MAGVFRTQQKRASVRPLIVDEVLLLKSGSLPRDGKMIPQMDARDLQAPL